MSEILGRLKPALLPAAPAVRRLPLGAARTVAPEIDFSSQKLSRGRVVSFQCDAGEYRRLYATAAANPSLADRIEARQARVGDRTARAAVALDDVAAGLGGFVPDLIEIDVEGGEGDVLRGAGGTPRDTDLRPCTGDGSCPIVVRLRSTVGWSRWVPSEK